MQIIWKGQSCFQIISQPAKNRQAHLNFASQNFGGQVRIVIDPFDETLGLRVPSLEGDILLISHNHYDHNNQKAVKGNPFLITGPGEYEIKGAFIQGVPAFHDNLQGRERGEVTLYTIETERIVICHLGDFGQKELTADQLEKIGKVDILMIPVGGVYTISSKEAPKVISQIEPQIVIPIHYQIPKLKLKLEGVDKFLKVMGLKSIEPQSKLTVKKKDLLGSETKVVVLKP